MSIFDNINRNVSEIKQQLELERKDADISQLQDTLNTYMGGGYAPRLKSREFLRSATGWVYSCVNAIADDVAMIGLHLKKYSDTDDEENEIFDNPALDLIYKPNNAMSKFDFINLTFNYLELTGEAPWFVSFAQGKPSALILLRPDRLTVKPGKDGEIIGGYKYSVNGNGGMQEIDLEPYEVIPLKYTDPDNILKGKGPLQAAAEVVDLDNYSQRWNSQFFKNSAAPSIALKTDRVLAKDVRRRLEEKIKQNYEGADNAHKTWVLEGGISVEKLSLSQKDMDFIEQQRFSRDKILAIFRVPRTAIGITDDVNRANAEATDYVFAKRTIKPKMTRFIEQLNTFYLPLFKNTENTYFTFDDPVPENTDQLINKANSGMQNGYITPNEARAMMGLDPVEGGDELREPQTAQPFLASNGQPLTAKAKKKVAPSNIKHMNFAKGRKGKEKKIFENKLKEGITKIVYDMLKAKQPKHKFVRKSVLITAPFSELKKHKYDFQAKQLKIADTFEDKMAKKVTSVFEVQRGIIIRGLDNGQKMTLDIETEKNRYKEALRSTVVGCMREQASEAFTLLGIQKSLDVKAAGGFIQRLGDYFDQRVFKFAPQVTRETNDKLRAAFKEAAEKEETIPQMKTRINELFGQMEDYRSDRIARSEIIRASNFATEQAYVDSGVVEAKEWLATKDERTDDECMAMDGKIIPLNTNFFNKGDTFNGLDLDYEAVGFPPLHVNCRCTLIPVIGTPIKEGEWRPSMNEEQAKQFVKNSAYKANLYHGTTQKAAEGIAKDGFDIHAPGGTGANIFDGVFLTDDKKNAANYAFSAFGAADNPANKPAVAVTKINVSKMGTFTEAQLYDLMKGKYGSNFTPAQLTEELSKLGYDAIKVNDEILRQTYIGVFDPKKVVQVRNYKPTPSGTE